MPQAFSREEHSWWIAPLHGLLHRTKRNECSNSPFRWPFYTGQKEMNVQIVPLDGLLHRTKRNECSNSLSRWPLIQDKKK